MSLAFNLFQAGVFHQLRREGQAAQGRIEAAMTLATEQGFTQILEISPALQGWAMVEQGQGEEGIVQIRHGLAATRATGAELLRPYLLALLAEAYGKTGQAEEGLNALAEALAAADKTGERWYEAELYRLKGELRQEEIKSKGLWQK